MSSVRAATGQRFDRRHTFHLASEYVDRGWSVIPLTGKRPALVSWREYQSRQPTWAEIVSWFSDRASSQNNIGIVTGAVSDLVVVDCDREEDTRYWLDHYPATPLEVRTGGGGVHFYYRAPGGIDLRNRARIYRRKIDVRASGGYVAAPPSCHESGRLYHWKTWGDYSLDGVPVVDPDWFGPSPRPNAPSLAIKDGPAYIQHIRAISGQGGHNATYRATCRLRDAGLTPEEALAALVTWNQTNAEPKWTTLELLHKVQSCYASEE